MAATSTLVAHDHQLPSSPTLINPDLILPYQAGRDRGTARTPSPPPQVLRTEHSSEIRSMSSQGPVVESVHYTRLTPTPSRSQRMASSSRSGRDRGNSTSTIGSTRTRLVISNKRTPQVGRSYGGSKITRLGSLPSQENILAPQKPERLIITSDDDEDDQEEHVVREKSRTYHRGGAREHEKHTPVNAKIEPYVEEPEPRPEPAAAPPIREELEEEGQDVDSHTDSANEQMPVTTEEARESEDQLTQLNEEGEDLYSSAGLSLRAEKILANAKKRLDNMEGNLSRARSSIIVSPSPSMSPTSRHTHSPTSIRTAPTSTSSSPHEGNSVHLRRIQPGPAGRHRQHFQPIASLSDHTSGGSPGHSRVFSETSVPSSLYSSIQSHSKEYNVARSRSVLSGTASSRSPHVGSGLSKSASVRDHRTHTHRATPSAALANGHVVGERNYLSSSPYARYSPITSPDLAGSNSRLDALSEENSKGEPGAEEEAALEYEESPPQVEKRLSSQDFANATGIGLGLSRSQSTYHMRDVRDQMKDLKGRISSLQQRAREDSLRRRSLQSLRTESPFTAAERWYLDGGDPPNPALPSHGADAARALVVPRSVEGSILDINDEDNQSFSLEHYSVPEHHALTPPDDDEYPEEYSLSSPVSGSPKSDFPLAAAATGERHEDRADAFDYENFFLHSRLGAYSSAAGTITTSLSPPSSPEPDVTITTTTTRRHISSTDPHSNANRYSTSSASSTATAKPSGPAPSLPKIDIYAEDASTPKRFPVHGRQASSDSVSTMDSFATATEGGRWGSGGSSSSLGLAISARPAEDRRGFIEVDDPVVEGEGEEEGEHTPTQTSPPPHAWPMRPVPNQGEVLSKKTSKKGAAPRSVPEIVTTASPTSVSSSSRDATAEDGDGLVGEARGGEGEGEEGEGEEVEEEEEEEEQRGLALEHLLKGDRLLIERVMQGIARIGGVLASEGVEEVEKLGLRDTMRRACELLEEDAAE